MERRRNPPSDQTPSETLRQLPAQVVLERIPVPVLAIADDGSILFANTGFADMLGYTPEEISALEFRQIFDEVPAAGESVLSVMHALANLVVSLAHRDGSTVRALMSKSVLTRTDDRVALATFQDLTEQLWLDER
ncbi:MAG: PAS domain-containing protein [Mycobacterium sp.]